MKLYSVNDKEFNKYGKVINGSFDEIIAAGEKFEMPQEGSTYIPSVDEFEALDVKNYLEKDMFGESEIQVGLCYGHSNAMNAFEWHKSSEINIAITDAILFLGNVWEIKDGKYNTENANAFLIKKGQAIEIYSTTLHFCPCETSANGFAMVIVLPKGTNTNLEFEHDNKMLFRKNKWIICHENNTALINRGVVPGVYGKNYEVKDL